MCISYDRSTFWVQICQGCVLLSTFKKFIRSPWLLWFNWSSILNIYKHFPYVITVSILDRKPSLANVLWPIKKSPTRNFQTLKKMRCSIYSRNFSFFVQILTRSISFHIVFQPTVQSLWRCSSLCASMVPRSKANVKRLMPNSYKPVILRGIYGSA